MDPETLKRLGLPADATQEQVEQKLTALENAGARNADLETQLRAAQLSTEEKTAQLATIELNKRASDLLAKETRLSTCRDAAIASGLWAPGSEREALFNDFAKLGVENAERYAKSLQPETPVGQPMTARAIASLDTNNFGKTEIGTCLSSVYQAGDLQVASAEQTFRKMGITPEAFAKYGPHAWELRDSDAAWLDDGAGSLEGWIQ